MSDELPADWLCLPCRDGWHAACLGSFTFCCCWTEVMLEVEALSEAEERTDGRDQ